MRRSRSNVLHSPHENAYAAAQQQSLPAHTRKDTGSIPVGTTPHHCTPTHVFDVTPRGPCQIRAKRGFRAAVEDEHTQDGHRVWVMGVSALLDDLARTRIDCSRAEPRPW